MKVIKYQLLTLVNLGSDTEPDWQETLTAVEMDWCQANEQIARKEAAEGIYHIEEREDT